METLSRLTQSRRFICNPLQRYPDNVRYSEETRLRSVSKSFLAAAYPRFESPDTSKDPKRGARARARPCISGTDITAVSPLSLRPPPPHGFLRLCSAARRASVNLHRRALNCICAYINSVYIPKAEYSALNVHPHVRVNSCLRAFPLLPPSQKPVIWMAELGSTEIAKFDWT